MKKFILFLIASISILLIYGTLDKNRTYYFAELVPQSVIYKYKVSKWGAITWNLLYDEITKDDYYLSLIVQNNSEYILTGIEVLLDFSGNNQEPLIATCKDKGSSNLAIEPGHNENIYMDCLVLIPKQYIESLPKEAFKDVNEIDKGFIDLGYIDVIGKKPPMKYMIWYQNIIDNISEVVSYPFNKRE